MNFFTAETMRNLLSPQHKLSCSWFLWRRLRQDLRKRGMNSSRESGAFLLGYQKKGRRRIVDYVLYDDLDPHCLDTGIVRFNGRYFSELWALCKARELSVVADVHVHPDLAEQSDSDRDYPMISRAGHVALIFPRFAAPPQARRDIGIFCYEGAKRWTAISPNQRSAFFHIGL